MNSLLLLISALIIFGFGYRFYSKLLATAVFRADSTPSIATKSFRGGLNSDSNPYILLGIHFGLVATAATLSGGALAVYWGWIPAFLWVVVGSTLAAGIYSVGSLWLCRRHAGESLTDIIDHYFPGAFVNAALMLMLFVLILFSALLLSISTALLVNYPATVLPILAFLLLTVVLGIFLRHRPTMMTAPSTAAAMLALIVFLWVFDNLAVGFSGSFNLDLAEKPIFTLNAALAWMALLLIFLFYTQRRPLSATLGSRAWLAACLFVLMLLILFIGIAIDHPQIIAPGFNANINDVRVLPWLLITLTGGAIAGIYLLIANHYTAPLLANDNDARVVGYGAVILEGLAAVSAIIICTAGFSSVTEWNIFYASWNGGLDPSYLLQLYINGFKYFASFVGLSPDFSSTYAAMSLIALCLSTMEVLIGLLNSLGSEVSARLGLKTKKADRRRLVVILLIVLIIAATSNASGMPTVAILYGIGNQLIVVLGLLLLVMALKKRKLPGQIPLAVILVLLPMTLWAIAQQLGRWWSQGDWWLLLPGLGIFAIGGWILLHTGQILWKTGRFGGRA